MRALKCLLCVFYPVIFVVGVLLGVLCAFLFVLGKVIKKEIVPLDAIIGSDYAWEQWARRRAEVENIPPQNSVRMGLPFDTKEEAKKLAKAYKLPARAYVIKKDDRFEVYVL